MNKLKWNAGQIVNDTSVYELAQYPATDKPKYLVDYDFKDMEIARLNHIIDELKENIQNLIYDIQPKGCLIIFNCEYDSEEDYIKGMKKEERLRTLEEVLDKLEELKEEGK